MTRARSVAVSAQLDDSRARTVVHRRNEADDGLLCICLFSNSMTFELFSINLIQVVSLVQGRVSTNRSRIPRPCAGKSKDILPRRLAPKSIPYRPKVNTIL